MRRHRTLLGAGLALADGDAATGSRACARKQGLRHAFPPPRRNGALQLNHAL